MVVDKDRGRLNNRRMFFIFVVVFASLLVIPAMGVTTLQCLAGISCYPTSITQTGNVSLKNASSTEIGGVLASNCTGTDKLSGVTGGGALVCSPDTNGSGYFIKQITIYSPLVSNESPITSNATLMVENASLTQLGVTKLTNCSTGFYLNGWNATNIPNCVGELNNGTLTNNGGSAGFIPNWFSSTSLNNSNIFQLGGFIGIGTTTPAVTLDLNGNLSVRGNLSVPLGNVSFDTARLALNTSNANFTFHMVGNMSIGASGSGNTQLNLSKEGIWFPDGTFLNTKPAGTVTSIAVDSTITANPSPIVSTGTLMATNATLTQLGVTKLTNCSTGFYLNGWNATNIPNCVGELNNGTVTSITASTGLSGGVITSSGTIALIEALTGTIGGVKILNCSSGYFMAQTNATGQLSCVGELNNGTVTSITASTGLSGGIITSSGTIALLEATSSTLGGFKSTGANCSSGYFLANVNATGQLSCVGELKNGTVTSITAGAGLSGGAISSSGTIALLDGQFKQPYYGRSAQYGWLRPLGTTATTFTAVGLAAFIANGSAAVAPQSDNYYINYTGTAAINNSAGLTQTLILTQARYKPILATQIFTANDNTNLKTYFGITSDQTDYYYVARGGAKSFSIEFNSNRSDTQWMCCSNDGTATGKTCTTTTIDQTKATPVNLTLNLSNYPTNFQCTVQNNTAISTITKSTNIDGTGSTNLGFQLVSLGNTAVAKNLSIAYVYYESK